MAPSALDRFLDPDRIVVVSSPLTDEDPAEVESESVAQPWAYPGVEAVVVEPSGVSEVSFSSGDLVTVDTPLTDQAAIVEAIADEPVEAVLLTGGEPGVDVPETLERAIRGAPSRLLGPGACVEIPGNSAVPAGGTGNGSSEIAILAHDRYVGRSIAGWATANDMALGPVVGVGAGIDVSFGEMSAMMAARAANDLVLGRSRRVDSGIVESFRGIDSETPVAVYPGSGAGLETHTGSEIQGADVARSILEQAGMVPVDSLEGMLDGGPALATQPLPDPTSVVVVSNAGGPGVMGIDAVGASGLDVARLTDQTIARLEEVVPGHGSARNPLDLLADSGIRAFEEALEASLADENVGAAVVMSAPSAIFSFEELAEIIVAARRRHELPIVTALMGGSRTEGPAEILREAGIPNYFDPYRAVGALDLLRRHASTVPMRHRSATVPDGYDDGGVDESLPKDGQLELAGADSVFFVESLGVEDVVPEEREDPAGIEMFVAGRRCPNRGPVVATGVSTFSQAVGDASVRGVPLGSGDAEAMLEELRAAPVLKGARGRAATNTEPVRTVLHGLSTLLFREPGVELVSLPSVTVSRMGLQVGRVEIGTSRDRAPESRG